MTIDPAVVVGIDGSHAALSAASWAISEAIDRDAILRFVSVVEGETSDLDARIQRAQLALDRAAGAVTADGRCPRMEFVIVYGQPDQALLDESSRAALICVGSGGAGWRSPIGAAARALAQYAACPVAIIRENVAAGEDISEPVVSVVLDDDPDNDAVVHQAMREGRLRHATVRQIDRRRDSWVRRYPDVHVETVAEGTGGGGHRDLAHTLPQLAVVGRADAEAIANLVAPNCHPIIGYPDCSVLVVRS